MNELAAPSYIENELKKFSITDSAIAKLAANYSPLKISGVDDRQGYIMVNSARIDIKNKRVEIEKKRKLLNQDALEFQRAINGEAKRITDLLLPIETYLETQEDAYKEEKERIKREKEEAETNKFLGRVNTLISYGFIFNGTSYLLKLQANHDDVQGNQLEINVLQLKNLGDEAFNGLITRLKAVSEIELAYIEAVKTKAAEEAARLEADKAAELAKLKAEREALEKAQQEQEAEHQRLIAQALEQDRQAAALKAEQERLEAEKKATEQRKEAAEQLTKEKEIAAHKALQLERNRIELERLREIEQKEKVVAETARLEALKPDKEKLLAIADKIHAFIGNNADWRIQDEKCFAICNQAFKKLKEAYEFIHVEINKI